MKRPFRKRPSRLPASRHLAAFALLLVLAALPGPRNLVPPASAQATQALRAIPAAAAFGEFEIGSYPEATIDGKSVRLAAGAQIRNTHNLIVMPASVSGRHPARYQLDPTGQLWRVWLLTADEAKAAQAARTSR